MSHFSLKLKFFFMFCYFSVSTNLCCTKEQINPPTISDKAKLKHKIYLITITSHTKSKSQFTFYLSTIKSKNSEVKPKKIRLHKRIVSTLQGFFTIKIHKYTEINQKKSLERIAPTILFFSHKEKTGNPVFSKFSIIHRGFRILH